MRITSSLLTSALPSALSLDGLPGSDVSSLMSIKLGRLPFASPLALCWNWTPRRDFAIATTTIEAIQAVVVEATETAWGSNVWG